MDYTGTFQNGMIRPDGPVNLPEGARVEFHVVGAVGAATPMEELRALSDRFFGGAKPGRGVAGVDVWPETEGVDEFLAFVREARR